MKKLLLAGAALGALIGAAAAAPPALAEDAPGGTLVPGSQLAQAPPPPPIGVNWTGFYLGVNAGIGWGSGKGTTSTGLSSGTVNVHGPLGGGTIGYNWQVNPSWVLGFEGDIDGTGISGSNNCPLIEGVGGSCHGSNTWLGTARLRLGWTPMASPWLLFVTGGGVFGDMNAAYTGGVGGVVNKFYASSTNAGWTVGAGAEYMVSPAWSLKLEYRHFDLGSFTATCSVPPCAAATKVTTTFDNGNAILAGLNFHFGVAPPPPAPVAMPAPPPAAPVVFIVFFDWDKDTITPEGMQIVQQAADAYKSGAPVQIQVTGYTDRSGSAGYNQRLSERRANNVAKAMAALGVPPASMVVSGRGENDNRVPTADGVREPQNRRVEIIKS